MTDLEAGDRVVMPFQIRCGSCCMCDQRLHPVRDHAGPRPGHGRGAVRLLQALRRGARRPGRVPPGPAGAVHARSRFPRGRRTSGSSTSPTCCPPPGRPSPTRTSPTAAPCWCSGSDRSATWPAGSPSTAAWPGHRRRPGARAARARAALAAPRSSTSRVDDELGDAIRDLTGGRGPTRSSTRSAWRRTARRSAKLAPAGSSAAARRGRRAVMQTAGIDRLAALYTRHRRRAPRRHDLPHRRLRRDGRPDADDDHLRQADPAADGPGQRQALGRRHHAAADRRGPARRRDFATHQLPLDEAPHAYEMFQKKEDGAVKVVLKP